MRNTLCAIKSVTWSVSNTAIASISSGGLLAAKSNGRIEVIATANDGTGVQGKVQITISGQTAIEDLGEGSLPSTPVLNQNYPNPFWSGATSRSAGNPATTISFSLPSKSFVSLKVFDALGREVSTLLYEELSSGSYSEQWNAVGLPSGVYFYRLQAGSFTETKKLVLLTKSEDRKMKDRNIELSMIQRQAYRGATSRSKHFSAFHFSVFAFLKKISF
jgi:hypothetical protein